MQPRKPWKSTVLTILCPGLGHVYAGQAARGATLYLAMLLATPLLAFLALRIAPFPLNLLLIIVGFIAVVFGIVRDAARVAKQQNRPFQPMRYTRGSVYLLLFVASLVVQEWVARPLVRIFVQAFRLPAGSMMPALQHGDHILVDKFRYHLAPIRRGDIILFKFPQDERRDFIKRVIGLPGETLELRGTQVLINGTPLDEPYAVYGDWPVSRQGEREGLGPIVIPPDRLFMLGDNRDHSMDSRVWGLLDVHKVRGKIVGIYFSWDADAGTVRWARIGAPVH